MFRFLLQPKCLSTGSFRIRGEDPRDALVKLIRNEVFVHETKSQDTKEACLLSLKQAAVQISEATYSLDERNTDNAWVETSVFSCHDELGEGILSDAIYSIVKSNAMRCISHRIFY